MFNLKKWLGVLAALVLAFPVAAAELIMVEEHGCIWCARWNAEIGPAYPNTSEGRFAPLRRVDISDIPDDLTILRRVNYTPTFLIVENGQEITRIEGYPGQDFFWPILNHLLLENTNFTEENG